MNRIYTDPSVKGVITESKEGTFRFDDKNDITANGLNNGEYKITVADEAEGTGTRQSAYKLKNKILNIYKETGRKVILDFGGVNVMSFSFADELLGKIISEYGFVFFTETFKLINLSEINIQILNRSVEQRMAQNYYAEPVEYNE